MAFTEEKEMIEGLVAMALALSGWSYFHPNPSFSVASLGNGSVVVTNTVTKEMQVCRQVGAGMSCESDKSAAR